jgi:hypothetical protein
MPYARELVFSRFWTNLADMIYRLFVFIVIVEWCGSVLVLPFYLYFRVWLVGGVIEFGWKLSLTVGREGCARVPFNIFEIPRRNLLAICSNPSSTKYSCNKGGWSLSLSIAQHNCAPPPQLFWTRCTHWRSVHKCLPCCEKFNSPPAAIIMRVRCRVTMFVCRCGRLLTWACVPAVSFPLSTAPFW